MYRIIKEISPENPTGIDYKYEDEYLTLEADIDKALSPTTSSQANWSLIVQNSEKVLHQSSKDLKILSYWLYAYWKVHTIKGLLRALPVYAKFLEKFSTNMYPKSNKAKINMLEWLSNTLSTQLVESYEFKEKKTFEDSVMLFKEIHATVQKIFPNNHDIFLPFIRRLEKKIEEKPIELPTQTKEKPKTIEKPPTENSNYSSSSHIKNIKNSIKLNAKTLNSQNILELLQVLGFLEIMETLSTKKEIPIELFPPQKLREKFTKITQSEQNEATIKELTETLLSYPAWIEGYYVAIQILQKISNQTDKNILEYKLIFFIKNYSNNIEKYSPSPYKILSKELKEWIETQENIVSGDSNGSHYEEKYLYAEQLFKEQKKEESINYLDLLYNDSKSHKEAFMWRIKQVELSILIGNKQLAIALLTELEERIEHHKIDLWDPLLSVQVYRLFLKPIIAKELNEKTKESIYTKLCRISPKEALSHSFL